MAWRPDGRRLAAGVMDGSVWVFYARYADVLEIAKDLNVPPLAQEELSTYLSE